MHYQIILTMFFLTKIKCDFHNSKNDSDVIVTYAGHAEANVELPIVLPETTTSSTASSTASTTIQEPPIAEVDDDEVVFIPADKPVIRNNYFSDDEVRVSDLMNTRIGDVVSNARVQTEPPSPDILFIRGKNNENVEKSVKETAVHEDTRRSGKEIVKPKEILNCTNLDCNNTLKSVCGSKIDRNKMKYRLFLNDCFFRKVNCAFKYGENRYKKVAHEKCNHIGSHRSVRPFVFKPNILPAVTEENKDVVSVRSFYSRRSLTKGVDGRFCSHPCPLRCPEEYDPECAISASGHRKVFVNHCKLDFNSCSYGVVWHRRPLSECVGGKKADMQQNRAFISWMQKVGIVDLKGRLVLS